LSKRVAIASVICIIFGSSSVIAGPVLNTWIGNTIEDNVDEILIAAKEEAIPIIEDLIDLINFVETVGFMYDPSPFEEDYDDTGTIFDTLIDVMTIPLVTELVVLRLFFDEVNLSLGFTSYTFSELISEGDDSYHMKGISEWAGKDLNFGLAKYKLIEGVGDLPGLCDEVYSELSAYSPEGAWAFMKLFNESKGNSVKEQALADGYGTSWYNIEKLVSYYYEYYVPVVVPQNLNHSLINLIYPIQNMTKEETANYFFYMQWANLLILENGLDLGQFNIIPGSPPGVLGLEAGYPDPMEMNISKIKELWNVSNPYAIVNNDGNRMWLSATQDDGVRSTLQVKLNLSLHDMECMIRWRIRLTSSVIPVLGGAYLGLGMDVNTWRNLLQSGLMILGGSLIVLGSTGIYTNHKYKYSRETLKDKIIRKIRNIRR